MASATDSPDVFGEGGPLPSEMSQAKEAEEDKGAQESAAPEAERTMAKEAPVQEAAHKSSEEVAVSAIDNTPAGQTAKEAVVEVVPREAVKDEKPTTEHRAPVQVAAAVDAEPTAVDETKVCKAEESSSLLSRPPQGAKTGSAPSSPTGSTSQAKGKGDDDRYRMTPEVLQKICKERNMWSQPHLNTQLYLHLKGFLAIEGLEAYVKVRALYLGNNLISKIEGLNGLVELRALHLEGNRIRQIENLEGNPELRILNLEANIISCVSGLSHLTHLEQLNLCKNTIARLEDVDELRSLPALNNIDVSSNQIEDTEGAIDWWANVAPQVKVLRFNGNPGVRNIEHYRKRLVNALTDLSYLDDRPVFPVERRSSAAWAEGGLEAMQKARQEYHKQRHNMFGGLTDEQREKITRSRQLAIARIEREAKEREEQEAQQRAKMDGSRTEPAAPPTKLEAGDAGALADYANAWQTRLSLHGAEALRSQAAQDAEKASSAPKRFQPPERRSQAGSETPAAASSGPQQEAGEGEATEKAGSAPRRFQPPERRSQAGPEKPAEAPPEPHREPEQAEAMPTSPSRRALASSARAQGGWGQSAADFRARTCDTGDGNFAERNFAVLGEGDSYGSLIGADGQQRTGRGGARYNPDKTEVQPLIWERMAEANKQAELKALEANFSYRNAAPEPQAADQRKEELNMLD